MSVWRRAMVGVFLLALAGSAPAISMRDRLASLAYSSLHPSSLSLQPFSATRNEWVAALELRTGEELATRDGRVRVESVARRPGTFRVYNLEVETEHCYFAGKARILSHNNNPCAVPSQPGEVENTSRAARRRAMRDVGTSTSRAATSQSGSGNRRQYVTEGADGRARVQTQHPPDVDHPTAHWHDAEPRVDPRTGELIRNRHGQVRYRSGGGSRGYRE